MAQIQLSPSGRATDPAPLLSAELNSLANNAGALSSSAIENVSDLDLYVDIELVATFGVAPAANTTLDVYFVRSVDGVNFEDASAAAPPQNGFVGSFPVQAITSVQRMVLPQILCPPRDFKVFVVNNATGQALAAAGNTLKGYFYRLSVA